MPSWSSALSAICAPAGSSVAPDKKSLYIGRSDGNEASLAAFGEVLYYAKALSDGERDKVIDYLRVAWGL